MSTTAIEDLLSVDTLTGLVRRFVDQSENRTCSALFEQHARPIRPAGRSATWDEVKFSRSLAPVTGVDSPHARARRLGVRQRSSVMAMVKVYKDLPGGHLFLDRAPGADTSDAEAILANELLDAVNLVQNTKEYLACHALLGRIEVDPQRIPGSEISFAVDFKTPQVSSVDWSDPTAKLRSSELLKLKRRYKDFAGQRAGSVLTDEAVEGYLVQNVEVAGFAKEALAHQVLTQTGPGEPSQWQGLAGLDWKFADGSYQLEGGPVTSYWPEDTALLLPQERSLRQVLGWAEGRVFVPAGDLFSTPDGITNQIRELRGHYAYAVLRDDPIGVRVYVGWYGLPLILDPSAVLRVNVRPQATPAAVLS